MKVFARSPSFDLFSVCQLSLSCLNKKTNRSTKLLLHLFCIEKSVEIASRINPTAKTSATGINIRAMFKSLARIVSFLYIVFIRGVSLGGGG
jgi:hypothetical protein